MNFEDYKNYLINYFSNGKIVGSYKSRRNYIKRNYRYVYLREILTNSYDFYFMLLEKIKASGKTIDENLFFYFALPIEENKNFHAINNSVDNNGVSDYIFHYEGKPISQYVLSRLLGEDFTLQLDYEENPLFDPYEDDGVHEHIPVLYIEKTRYNKTLKK